MLLDCTISEDASGACPCVLVGAKLQMEWCHRTMPQLTRLVKMQLYYYNFSPVCTPLCLTPAPSCLSPRTAGHSRTAVTGALSPLLMLVQCPSNKTFQQGQINFFPRYIFQDHSQLQAVDISPKLATYE